LESLDVLRGLTVVLMMLVNTSGGPANGYRLPRHRRI
jgi:predicted acyltransferase